MARSEGEVGILIVRGEDTGTIDVSPTTYHLPPITSHSLENSPIIRYNRTYVLIMEQGIFNFVDLLSITSPSLNWLIPGFLPEGALTLLAGEPGSGKSFLALDLAIRLATARPAWQAPSQPPLPVVYYCQDSTRFHFGRRLQALTSTLTPDEKDLLSKNITFDFNPFNIRNARTIANFIERFKSSPSCLMIFDVLARYLPNMSDNHISSVGPALRFFNALTEIEFHSHRISVLVLHHLNKRPTPGGKIEMLYGGELGGPSPDQNRVRGSTDIVANVDLAWSLQRQGSLHLLSQLKNRLTSESVDQPAFRIHQQGEHLRLAYESLSPEDLLALSPPKKLHADQLAFTGLLRILQAHPGEWLSRRELTDLLAENQPLPGERNLKSAFIRLRDEPAIHTQHTRAGLLYRANNLS